MMQFDQALKFLEMVCNDLLPKIEEESARSATKLLMEQSFSSVKKEHEQAQKSLKLENDYSVLLTDYQELVRDHDELDAKCFCLEDQIDDLKKKIDSYENPPDQSEDDDIGNGEG